MLRRTGFFPIGKRLLQGKTPVSRRCDAGVFQMGRKNNSINYSNNLNCKTFCRLYFDVIYYDFVECIQIRNSETFEYAQRIYFCEKLIDKNVFLIYYINMLNNRYGEKVMRYSKYKQRGRCYIFFTSFGKTFFENQETKKMY